MASVTDQQKLKVFICYSRADAAFADELVAGLEFDKFGVINRPPFDVEGEDCTKRLGALIADADTVVFLPIAQIGEVGHLRLGSRGGSGGCRSASCPCSSRPSAHVPAPPRSPRSTTCASNVEIKNSARSWPASTAWCAPSTLISTGCASTRGCRAGDGMGRRWATRQSAAVRHRHRRTKGWLARRPKDAPEATELHLAFIKASEQSEADATSAERKRLEEMAAAQAASATARGARGRSQECRGARPSASSRLAG